MPNKKLKNANKRAQRSRSAALKKLASAEVTRLERLELRNAFKLNNPSYLWYFSPWVKRFVNTFVIEGKKATAGKIVRETFFALKKQGLVHPYLMLFEIFEMLRLPVRAFGFSQGRRTRMIIQRLPWWRQYTTVTQWFRSSLVSRIAKSNSASKRLVQEFVALMETPAKSRVWQRRVVAYQAIAEGRQLSRFTWTPKVQERLEAKLFQTPPYNDPLINHRVEYKGFRKWLRYEYDSKRARHLAGLVAGVEKKRKNELIAKGRIFF
jgi:ribosomal protein S7